MKQQSMTVISGYFLETPCIMGGNNPVSHHSCLRYFLDYYKDHDDHKFVDIIHTDKCPKQYKFHQNFLSLQQLTRYFQCVMVHQFSQKYGSKGNWDILCKLVRHVILKNELKHKICADTMHCFLKLQKYLGKNETILMNKKYIEWENSKHEKILFNKTFFTQNDFIGLAVDIYDNFLSLKKYRELILFTDRKCVHDMHHIKNTQSFLQVLYKMGEPFLHI